MSTEKFKAAIKLGGTGHATSPGLAGRRVLLRSTWHGNGRDRRHQPTALPWIDAIARSTGCARPGVSGTECGVPNASDLLTQSCEEELARLRMLLTVLPDCIDAAEQTSAILKASRREGAFVIPSLVRE